MADISISENPVFHVSMTAMTKQTPAHADEFNQRYKQLLENDVSLQHKEITDEEIDRIEEIEVEMPDYEGDVTQSDIDYILSQ